MSDEHELYREWSAAYVLGALSSSERASYERHLDHCQRCRDDVAAFSPLPGLLGKIDPDEQEVGSGLDRVTELAMARAEHDYGRLRISARRWRRLALAGLGAAAVVVMLGFIPALGGGRTVGGDELAFEAVGAGVAGSVVVAERPWGTSIDLDLVGLPRRDAYQLWAIATDGSRRSAATWSATRQGVARLTGAAAIPTAELDHLEITSADERDVVLWTT